MAMMVCKADSAVIVRAITPLVSCAGGSYEPITVASRGWWAQPLTCLISGRHNDIYTDVIKEVCDGGEEGRPQGGGVAG